MLYIKSDFLSVKFIYSSHHRPALDDRSPLEAKKSVTTRIKLNGWRRENEEKKSRGPIKHLPVIRRTIKVRAIHALRGIVVFCLLLSSVFFSHHHFYRIIKTTLRSVRFSIWHELKLKTPAHLTRAFHRFAIILKTFCKT